jgi:hypothetical protein
MYKVLEIFSGTFFIPKIQKPLMTRGFCCCAILLRQMDWRSRRALDTKGIDEEMQYPVHANHDEKPYQSPEEMLLACGNVFLFPTALVHKKLCSSPDEYQCSKRHHEYDYRIYDQRIETRNKRVNRNRRCSMKSGKPP